MSTNDNVVKLNDPELRPDLGASKKFLLNFMAHHKLPAKILLRAYDGRWQLETVVDVGDDEDLEICLGDLDENRDTLFFAPRAWMPEEFPDDTHFGWADTGRVCPAIMDPHPIAYWLISPGRYQCLWYWEKPIPVRASVARVASILLEHDLPVGSNEPNEFLHVPGSLNCVEPEGSESVVKLIYDKLSQQLQANSAPVANKE